MAQREWSVDAACPSCGHAGLDLRTMTEELPYFGETLLTTVSCAACGFKHADSMVLARRPASRHTLRFRAPGDLGVRVARSPTGTYRVPELGFTAEPGEGSESFVSNVEGVLERVRDVLVRARLLLEEPAQQARAEELLRKLQDIVEGRREATLVLEDPFGNSTIVSDRAHVEELPEDEAARLRTGMMVFDARDLEPVG